MFYTSPSSSNQRPPPRQLEPRFHQPSSLSPGGGGLPWVVSLPAAGRQVFWAPPLCPRHCGRCWPRTPTQVIAALGAAGQAPSCAGNVLGAGKGLRSILSHEDSGGLPTGGHSTRALKTVSGNRGVKDLSLGVGPLGGALNIHPNRGPSSRAARTPWKGASPRAATFNQTLGPWPFSAIRLRNPGPGLPVTRDLRGRAQPRAARR